MNGKEKLVLYTLDYIGHGNHKVATIREKEEICNCANLAVMEETMSSSAQYIMGQTFATFPTHHYFYCESVSHAVVRVINKDVVNTQNYKDNKDKVDFSVKASNQYSVIAFVCGWLDVKGVLSLSLGDRILLDLYFRPRENKKFDFERVYDAGM